MDKSSLVFFKKLKFIKIDTNGNVYGYAFLKGFIYDYFKDYFEFEYIKSIAEVKKLKNFKFNKYDKLSNDLIESDIKKIEKLKDEFNQIFGEISKIVSDPIKGINLDGIILIVEFDLNFYRFFIFNKDGSRAKMCGNGLRGAAAFITNKLLNKFELKKKINLNSYNKFLNNIFVFKTDSSIRFTSIILPDKVYNLIEANKLKNCNFFLPFKENSISIITFIGSLKFIKTNNINKILMNSNSKTYELLKENTNYIQTILNNFKNFNEMKILLHTDRYFKIKFLNTVLTLFIIDSGNYHFIYFLENYLDSEIKVKNNEDDNFNKLQNFEDSIIEKFKKFNLKLLFLLTHKIFFPEAKEELVNVSIVGFFNNNLFVRTFERGSGETITCGTANAAVAFVLAKHYKLFGKDLEINNLCHDLNNNKHIIGDNDLFNNNKNSNFLNFTKYINPDDNIFNGRFNLKSKEKFLNTMYNFINFVGSQLNYKYNIVRDIDIKAGQKSNKKDVFNNINNAKIITHRNFFDKFDNNIILNEDKNIFCIKTNNIYFDQYYFYNFVYQDLIFQYAPAFLVAKTKFFI